MLTYTQRGLVCGVIGAIANYLICGAMVSLASFGICLFVGIMLDVLDRKPNRQGKQQAKSHSRPHQTYVNKQLGGANQAPLYTSSSRHINHRRFTDEELRELIKKGK